MTHTEIESKIKFFSKYRQITYQKYFKIQWKVVFLVIY